MISSSSGRGPLERSWSFLQAKSTRSVRYVTASLRDVEDPVNLRGFRRQPEIQQSVVDRFPYSKIRSLSSIVLLETTQYVRVQQNPGSARPERVEIRKLDRIFQFGMRVSVLSLRIRRQGACLVQSQLDLPQHSTRVIDHEFPLREQYLDHLRGSSLIIRPHFPLS